MKPGIEHILKYNEKVLWSGQPDLQAIKQTRYPGGGMNNTIIIVLLIAGFVWVMSRGEATWSTHPAMNWIWLATAASILWVIYKRLYFDKKKLMQWAGSLAYVITDKRILILRGGAIDHAPDLGSVQQFQTIPRKGSSGFSDLIWEKRAIDIRTSGGNVKSVSPLEREQAETGFKALADAASVKQILDDWVKQQQLIIQNQDSDSISQSQTTSSNSDNSTITKFKEYVSPCFGFSMGFPTSWEISSRYRKLAFGKSGIEREAKWSTPDAKPEWNVILGQNKSKTLVEVQVQKIAAFNTLESLMGTSGVATALGQGEIIDHEASISVNGIPGFYVTRHSGAGFMLPSQIEEILSNWYIRRYILHDGIYQYYIEAMWPVDDQGQQEICEAIIATLKPC